MSSISDLALQVVQLFTRAPNLDVLSVKLTPHLASSVEFAALIPHPVDLFAQNGVTADARW